LQKKILHLNITGADAAQHLKLFSLCKAQFAEYQMKKMIFLCTAAKSLSIVSNFTSVFFSSFLFSSPQTQISKFRKCMFSFPPSSFLLPKLRFQNSGNVCSWVVATEYSLLACLTASSLSLIRSVSRKPLCKTELLDYNTFSAKRTQTSRKRSNKAKRN
jgi:hypothetical protein